MDSALEFSAELSIYWRPREDSDQQQADDLFKVKVESDWSLNSGVYLSVMKDASLGGRLPDLVAFASLQLRTTRFLLLCL